MPGGEVYQRLLLELRYQLEPELNENEIDAAKQPWSKRSKNWRRDLEGRGLAWEPSFYIRRKRNIALQLHGDFQRFGLPYSGGLWEQHVDWVRAVTCVMQAYEDHEREKQVERAREARRKRSKDGDGTIHAPFTT